MLDVSEIRLINAREIVRKECESLADFADKIDRAPTQISRIIGKRPTKSIGHKMARHIELCFNLPAGWLDQNHESAQEIESITPEVKESSALYMTLTSESDDIDLLKSVIESVEKIQELEQIELSAEEKAQAIIACLQTCIKRGKKNSIDLSVATAAIHAVM